MRAPSGISEGYWWTNPVRKAERWHLTRLDDYQYDPNDGVYWMCPEGGMVTIYVIDSGVWAGHEQFTKQAGSSVIEEWNFVRHEVGSNAYPMSVPNDPCSTSPALAHGTKVAALAAGNDLGSSHARISSLRVHGCAKSGYVSDLVGAVNWLAQRPRSTAGVVNLSGFVPPFPEEQRTLDDAVTAMVNATDMPFITSADNFATDACTFAPNSLGYNPVTRQNGKVLVVGGSMILASRDARWQREHDGVPIVTEDGTGSGSNAGDCVGLYAPGDQITVALNNTAANQPQYGKESGTSYASPIVAGLAARYIEDRVTRTGTKPTARQVYEFLTTTGGAYVENANEKIPKYWICFRPDNGGDLSGNFQSRTVAEGAACPNPEVFTVGPLTFELKLPLSWRAPMAYYPVHNDPNIDCGGFITEEW